MSKVSNDKGDQRSDLRCASVKREIEQGFTEFAQRQQQWAVLHRKGEGLVRLFFTDIAGLDQAASIDKTVAQKLGLSEGLLAQDARSAVVAERRLSEIHALMTELDKLLESMRTLLKEAEDKVASFETPEEQQSLADRGPFMCAPSVLDYLQFMIELLEMYNSEYSSKKVIVDALSFSMPSSATTTYLMTWRAQPFLDEQRIATIKRCLALAST